MKTGEDQEKSGDKWICRWSGDSSAAKTPTFLPRWNVCGLNVPNFNRPGSLAICCTEPLLGNPSAAKTSNFLVKMKVMWAESAVCTEPAVASKAGSFSTPFFLGHFLQSLSSYGKICQNWPPVIDWQAHASVVIPFEWHLTFSTITLDSWFQVPMICLRVLTPYISSCGCGVPWALSLNSDDPERSSFRCCLHTNFNSTRTSSFSNRQPQFTVETWITFCGS